MKLLTKEILKKLPKLGETENIPAEDKVVQVKFFNPCGGETWYGIEFDGKDTFFGYVTGSWEDEFGYFSLSELAAIKTRPFGLGIERDRHFPPTKLGDTRAFKARG